MEIKDKQDRNFSIPQSAKGGDCMPEIYARNADNHHVIFTDANGYSQPRERSAESPSDMRYIRMVTFGAFAIALFE